MGVEKEGTYDIVSSAKHALYLAILGGCVGAREAIHDTVGREEGGKRSVDEFAAIVTLHTLDESVKLGKYVGKETLQDRGCLGLIAQRKRPRVMRVIIKNYDVILITRETHNRGGPQIIMNKLERSTSTTL